MLTAAAPGQSCPSLALSITGAANWTFGNFHGGKPGAGSQLTLRNGSVLAVTSGAVTPVRN